MYSIFPKNITTVIKIILHSYNFDLFMAHEKKQIKICNPHPVSKRPSNISCVQSGTLAYAIYFCIQLYFKMACTMLKYFCLAISVYVWWQ